MAHSAGEQALPALQNSLAAWPGSVRIGLAPIYRRVKSGGIRRGSLVVELFVAVVAMPPPGGCARGGGQWAGTHGPPGIAGIRGRMPAIPSPEVDLDLPVDLWI